MEELEKVVFLFECVVKCGYYPWNCTIQHFVTYLEIVGFLLEAFEFVYEARFYYGNKLNGIVPATPTSFCSRFFPASFFYDDDFVFAASSLVYERR